MATVSDSSSSSSDEEYDGNNLYGTDLYGTDLLAPDKESIDEETIAYSIARRIKDAGRNIFTDGSYESYDNTIYLSGACNVGKSTLASQFIGQEIPQTWKSTDGLMIHYGQNGIDLELKIMVPIKKDLNVFSKIVRGKAHLYTAELHHEKHADADVSQNNPNKSKSSLKGDTTHFETQFYKLTKEFLQGVRKRKYRIDIAPSDVVDFGGQRSFDLTHQLFIRRKGSFIVMFDGRYGFSEPLPEYPELMTNEKIVKHWVFSILTYCVEGPGLLPMILFAATHSDHFTKDVIKAKKDEYLAILNGYFGNHIHRDHIVLDKVYFINARDRGDKEVLKLQKRLVKIAIQQPDWGQRKPVRWVPLEMQITEMRKDGQFIIEKDQLQKVNKSNGDLSLTEEQVEDFLEFQHSAGKIIYYNRPGLKGFVVLYPPALVNVLRSFITDESFWPTTSIVDRFRRLIKRKSPRKILMNLQKSGKLRKKDLMEVWKQPFVSIKDEQIAEFVIHLLVFLDILIVPRQDQSVALESNAFLVPCVVKRELPSSYLADETFHERCIALVFSLKKSNAPSALAYKIIGAAASIWPLKQEGDLVELYQFAAVLNVDSENDMILFVKDSRIVVYLINQVSKVRIQPDVAASIQECLVNALNYTLHFYNNSMGLTKETFTATDLYDIYVGEICRNEPCVIKVEEAQQKSHWNCQHGFQHKTSMALSWMFDRHVSQCHVSCNGLSDEFASQVCEDLFLVRLSTQLGITYFRNLMVTLGLDVKILDILQDKYGSVGFTYVTMFFMAFKKWCDKQTDLGKEPIIKDISTALVAVGESDHLLCQIFRHVSKVQDIADHKLQVVPKDTVLRSLSQNMGYCTVHLGLELRLTFTDVEETLYRHQKDMLEQTYDILRKWKQKFGDSATIFKLIEAVDRVDKGGLRFLLRHYKLSNKG